MILLAISTTWKTVIMIVAMIVVFYLFLIRPQSQQAKKEAAYRDSLKSGDRIMTSGGIHATIVSTDASPTAPESRWLKPASSPSPKGKKEVRSKN